MGILSSEEEIAELDIGELQSLKAEFWKVNEGPSGLIRFRCPECLSNETDVLHCLFVRVANALGSPLHVIERWPLVHNVSVQLNARRRRFGSVGEIGLHVDIVNSQAPPDAVAFFCIRPDPGGGGTIRVANMQATYATLGDSDRAALDQAEGEEEAFYGFCNVGHRLDPYPIVEQTSFGPRIRVTGKTSDGDPGQGGNESLERFLRQLRKNAFGVKLQRGDALIINQRKYAHGRDPLGPDQPSIPEDCRRLLRRGFIRAPNKLDL